MRPGTPGQPPSSPQTAEGCLRSRAPLLLLISSSSSVRWPAAHTMPFLLTRCSRSHPCEDGIARHAAAYRPGLGRSRPRSRWSSKPFAIHDVWGAHVCRAGLINLSLCRCADPLVWRRRRARLLIEGVRGRCNRLRRAAAHQLFGPFGGRCGKKRRNDAQALQSHWWLGWATAETGAGSHYNEKDQNWRRVE